MKTTAMGKIGAHVSIAGGIQNAPERAAAEGCETFQCFTRSPQGGPAPKLTEEVVAGFRRNMRGAGITRFCIHAPYYINLASTEDRILHSSIRVVREELERGSVLGAHAVMFHPGSYHHQTPEAATTRVRGSMERILDGYTGTCLLLVEISAGAGSVLGDTFEEVAAIIEPFKGKVGFGGVCFDTCHAFASGYDFRTPTGVREVLQAFDDAIGLQWLRMTHVNDSKVDVGGHRDRHEHIGKGFIGTAGLASLLSTPPFMGIDWILETETQGREGDVTALREIRSKGRES